MSSKEGRAWWPHAAAGLFVIGMLASAALWPDAYHAAVQEDGPIEWATAALFAVAGALRLGTAVRARRPFDGLVGLFCLFVAGEEVSWGQRLLGFTPPDYFLERNFQQEANLHNFADLFGRPGSTLALLLAAYGLMPAAARWRAARSWMERLGASPPALLAGAWLLLAALLLWVYPVEYTGEWVEALAGGLFLATRPGSPRRPSAEPGLLRPASLGATVPWVVAAGLAILMTAVSREGDASPRRVACAGAEAEALVRDLVGGSAALQPLAAARYVHKRVFTAAEEGYVDPAGVTAYRATPPCAGESGTDAAQRRAFAVDPWGMSYWVVSDARDGARRVVVYSMGPNRRRDGAVGEPAGDDVVAYAEL